MKISARTRHRIRYLVPVLGAYNVKRDFEKGAINELTKLAVIEYNYVMLPAVATYIAIASLYLLK